MFDVSPEGANFWFDFSNVVLFVGAVLVALGTYGTIKFATIKERYSDERIASNEAETRRATADSDAAKEGTAKANERIAELSTQAEQLRKDTAQANAKALEAQLALEKFKAPRVLTPDQQSFVSSMIRQFAPQPYVLSVGMGQETFELATMIEAALIAAGWRREPPLGMITIFNGQASATSGSGIGVQVAASRKDDLGIAATALANALTAMGLPAKAELSEDVRKDLP
jgi:hypothetical protein